MHRLDFSNRHLKGTKNLSINKIFLLLFFFPKKNSSTILHYNGLLAFLNSHSCRIFYYLKRTVPPLLWPNVTGCFCLYAWLCVAYACHVVPSLLSYISSVVISKFLSSFYKLKQVYNRHYYHHVPIVKNFIHDAK